MTGETHPVLKGPHAQPPSNRIVLQGSDVIAGMGEAVVIAVGRQTRLGALAAALNCATDQESPLDTRLGRVLRIAGPLAVAGGTVVGGAGLIHGLGGLAEMITLGVVSGLNAIPYGLPLLAGAGQAAVSQRLARQNALVRRLAGVEALGRVDIACIDKTGTLTEGKLAVVLLAVQDEETAWPGALSEDFRDLLSTAALASPCPAVVSPFEGMVTSPALHPTDLAVIEAAQSVGLHNLLCQPRQAEAPFYSTRSFHASLVGGRLHLKGAPERLIPRCTKVRKAGSDQPLDDAGRAALLARAAELAQRGHRILLAAQGPADTPVDNPRELTALGYLGIHDPLRVGVHEAVQRCHKAGLRVLMLTGDHPATAHAVARDAGLLTPGRTDVLTAAELTELPPEERGRRLSQAAVVARATPLDKLGIVRELRRCGHSVAMTGDGINDAPSLRLADVGVAMGKTGTEVARQASDVVLIDDNFGTLVNALVEGRSFWRNMRSSIGMLTAGNVGEMGFLMGAGVCGLGVPLDSSAILLMGMIGDVLPTLALVLQRPPDHRLEHLAQEGLSALDKTLRREPVVRGLANAAPSLTAYLLALPLGAMQANSVAFASLVSGSLLQTLDSAQSGRSLRTPLLTAVGGSLALLGGALLIPGVGEVFALATPGVQGWGLVGASAASSVVLRRLIQGGVDLPAALQKLWGQADVPSSNGPAAALQGVP
jgi:magnesium-transporting ATPase (P-type)